MDTLLAQGFVRPGAERLAAWTSTVPEALDTVEAGLARTRLEPAPDEVAEELLESEP